MFPKQAFVAAGLLLAIAVLACNNPSNPENSSDTAGSKEPDSAPVYIKPDSILNVPELSEFLPIGFVLFDTVLGDLNKDGVADCVVIIKGTDSSLFVNDEYRGRLDRNRRGILVLLNNSGKYELISKNYSCFSSENEDGGVYYAPELYIEIQNGNLYINYLHGRYGYYKYTFRYRNSDLELIGYDESEDSGPVVDRETSINFLTKKKQVKVNENENAVGGDEKFKETWSDVTITKLIRLSEIKDFDELDMSQW